jgi:2-phosphoglycerate kinase
MRKVIVLITGAPCCGKTTLAMDLSSRLGLIPLISTDIVRFMMMNQCRSKIVRYVSHEAWKATGKYTKENVIKGYRKLCKIVTAESLKIAMNAFKRYNMVILEGVLIDPILLRGVSNLKCCWILMSRSYATNVFNDKVRFRSLGQNDWANNLAGIEIIKNYLDETFQEYLNIVKIENFDYSPENICKVAIDLLDEQNNRVQ